MADLPLVTVCVLAHNHDLYIEECIQSILAQTYGNWQLFVWDNGSVDNTPNIILSLSKQYGFTFCLSENIGICKAFNAMLDAHPDSQYICFIAADDVMMHHRLEKQVVYMESHKQVGMSYGKVRLIDGKGKMLNQEWEPLYKGKSGWLLKDIVKGKVPITAPTIMFRRTCFDVVGPYDENMPYEDADMNIRIAEKYPIGFIDDWLCYYRRHAANLSANKRIFQRNEDAIRLKHKKYYTAEVIHYLKAYEFRCLAGNNKIKAIKLLPHIWLAIPSRHFFIGALKLLFDWRK